MDRRTFIGTLAGGLLVLPATAGAQQAGTMHRIGFLLLSPRDVQLHLIAAFEAGLREKGYTPGREVVIEYRYADGHSDQLSILAAELVRLGVDVIVTGVNP